MKNFCIITNTEKDEGLAFTNYLSNTLEARGCRCTIWQAKGKLDGEFHYTDPRMIPEDVECILVLGGDGTLLQAARDLVHVDVPFLGFNLGTLGFLAEVSRSAAPGAVEKLLADDYTIEERMMLSGTVYRGDEIIGKDIALNDVVISRSGHLRVVKFNNYVNGIYLNSYSADGIIISTPTGSTGYSLSAGGPIVSPNASLMILTPVAPHTMNTRSVILPPEDVITVEIGEGHVSDAGRAIASFDGDTEIPMLVGDRIVIRRSADRTRILKLKSRSFVEVLRRKMENNR